MGTLVIRTNASQVEDVLIRDMGFFVPGSGGSETFIDPKDLQDAKESLDLRALAQDDIYGINSSTLILNDGGTDDVPQDQVDQFLDNIDISGGITIGDVVLVQDVGGGTAPVPGLPALDGSKLVNVAGANTTFAGNFEQATTPTVIQIPDGKWGFWWDTVNSRLTMLRNRGGTMYCVELAFI